MTQTIQVERPDIFVTSNDWKNENGDFRCFLLETGAEAPLKGDLICIENAPQSMIPYPFNLAVLYQSLRNNHFSPRQIKNL